MKLWPILALVIVLGCGGGGTALNAGSTGGSTTGGTTGGGTTGGGTTGGGGGGGLLGSWHGPITETQKTSAGAAYAPYATGNVNIKFFPNNTVDMWSTYRTPNGLESGQRHITGTMEGNQFAGVVVTNLAHVTGTMTRQGINVFLVVEWSEPPFFRKGEATLTFDEFQKPQ